MQPPFPSKGAKPVPELLMLNFLHWLSINHPNAKNLRKLQDDVVLQLINEFESSRPSPSPYTTQDWFKSIDQLHNGSKDGQYKKAIAFSQTLK